MTEQPLPLTQEQSRQTNTRFDHMEQTIDEQGRELRQEIAAQGQQTNTRFDRIEQAIDKQSRRTDVLTRWLVGMQVTSLVALGTLILLRLP